MVARTTRGFDANLNQGDAWMRPACLEREAGVMTMYLSNRDVRPTGDEPGEFIEPSTFTPPEEPSPETPEAGGEDEDSSAR